MSDPQELIDAYLDRTLKPDGREALEAWILADERNAALFVEAVDIDRQLSERGRRVPRMHEADPRESRPRAVLATLRRRWPLTAAAALLLASGFLALWACLHVADGEETWARIVAASPGCPWRDGRYVPVACELVLREGESWVCSNAQR